MGTPTRVLIVDRHQIVRQGVRRLLADSSELEVAGEASGAAEALAMTERLEPDVVLLDLMLPDLDGIEAIGRLRWLRPRAAVVVLTMLEEEWHIQGAIEAGAIGYVLYEVQREDLLRALRCAGQGIPWLHPKVQLKLMQRIRRASAPCSTDLLTARENGILRLLAAGHSNKSIASRLCVSEGTVKGHVSAILSKLGFEDRTQAALLAYRRGLIAVEPALAPQRPGSAAPLKAMPR
jgi:NarL family two-component system response regulator LiaR